MPAEEVIVLIEYRTPHILEFIGKAADFMAGPPTITLLDVVA